MNLEKNFSIYRGTSKDLEIIFSLNDRQCHHHGRHHCCCCHPYQMEENDILTLQVVDYRKKDKIIIEKVCKGDNFFSFIPSDTEDLGVGYYRYNVRLELADEGGIYQIIAPSVFHIKGDC